MSVHRPSHPFAYIGSFAALMVKVEHAYSRWHFLAVVISKSGAATLWVWAAFLASQFAPTTHP
jgi:hypothetical protein